MTSAVTAPPPTTARLAGHPWRPVLAGATGLGVCVLVNVVDPNEPGALGTCPSLLVTGLDCPGCGTLRAVRALTRGDLLLALDHNVLTVLLLPLLLVALVTWWSSERGTRPHVWRPTWLAPALTAVLPVFVVLRNLPGSWLAA